MVDIDTQLLRSVARSRKLARRTQMYRDALVALRTHVKADKNLPNAIWDSMFTVALDVAKEQGVPEGQLEQVAEQAVVMLVGERQPDVKPVG